MQHFKIVLKFFNEHFWSNCPFQSFLVIAKMLNFLLKNAYHTIFSYEKYKIVIFS